MLRTFLGNVTVLDDFFNKLETLLRDKSETVFNVHFTENLIVFGVDNYMKTDSIFDCIVLHAKTVYTSADLTNDCQLSSFVHQLTFSYKIEGYNAKINGGIAKFNLNWLFFECIVQEEYHIMN